MKKLYIIPQWRNLFSSILILLVTVTNQSHQFTHTMKQAVLLLWLLSYKKYSSPDQKLYSKTGLQEKDLKHLR